MNGTMMLEQQTPAQETPNANTGNSFPWAGQPDETACNYAFGHLVRNLPARMSIEGKLHAPTLMAAAGAIAGVSAQVSLLADAERLAKAQKEARLQEVTLKDGRVFLYGDALNEMLYSVREVDTARSRVWNMMVSAALQQGLERKDLPSVPDMFRHVSESFGTPMEGRPSVETKVQPIMPVRELLRLVGPVSFAALAGEIDPVTAKAAGACDRKSWVAISAQAAANMMLNAARIMPPKLALSIAMESAIYASKLRARVSEQPEAEQAQA
jgi:hypothetical protein